MIGQLIGLKVAHSNLQPTPVMQPNPGNCHTSEIVLALRLLLCLDAAF